MRFLIFNVVVLVALFYLADDVRPVSGSLWPWHYSGDVQAPAGDDPHWGAEAPSPPIVSPLAEPVPEAQAPAPSIHQAPAANFARTESPVTETDARPLLPPTANNGREAEDLASMTVLEIPERPEPVAVDNAGHVNAMTSADRQRALFALSRAMELLAAGQTARSANEE